ncbi:syntaxin binding protein 1, putative [Ichthyophthirius multifiliis]|uniref:Syntaxin binding protein 1, putative n=1 Tax=Ichthyophthirius multifiliis TaxID=5932 RepID=G0R1E7_ICHMU|nr:syntaxin binding protein 1, putative [Ichthyophthirius multifiliis]EGR28704.1 syntaxin binding protein 1, putative [Ichthyophthirius multifiliis]|eukprot:XP_004029940.1 syntaxin binding protein 1, putative [Ichthyophthirius multifiliis]
MEKKQQFSLKDNCKQRLKTALEDIMRQNKTVQQYILITDQNSLKIISSLMKMTELLELNIISVEKIDNERPKHSKHHAIYFISPYQDSIDLLLNDFPQKKGENQYGKVHLYLTNRIEENLMSKIATNKYLLNRILTFKEFNQDFACKFDNIFNLEVLDSLKTIFSESGKEYKNKIMEISDKISTVILSFERMFSIEIFYNIHENKISQTIAEQMNERLKNILNQLQSENSEQINRKSGKITVLILDRSFDVLTPFLRDFHYQPLLYDVLDIKNDIVEYWINEGPKEVLKKSQLNEQDELFKKYRFAHIGEVMSGIGEQFNDFVKINSTAKVQMAGGVIEDLDFGKMQEIIRSMPQYQEQLAKYNMHMKLIGDIWKVFEDKNLKDLGELEQNLSTGIDGNGEKIKEKAIYGQALQIIQNDILNDYDKIRLKNKLANLLGGEGEEDEVGGSQFLNQNEYVDALCDMKCSEI